MCNHSEKLLLKLIRDYLIAVRVGSHKLFKKIAIGILCAMFISVLLGIIDCYIVGTAIRHTLFSVRTRELSGEDASGYVGFGYSITYYHKSEGDMGPEIWYWFLPFAISDTSERVEFHWVFPFGTKEPAYQGKSLGSWITLYYKSYSKYPFISALQDREAAERAIRSIGTNSISTLIKLLSDTKPGINQYSTVLQVFRILGEEGRPAIPSLIHLVQSKNREVRYYALDCLFAINTDKEVLVPILILLVHDPDVGIRYRAAEHLVGLDADAAKNAGVINDFPQFVRFIGNASTDKK